MFLLYNQEYWEVSSQRWSCKVTAPCLNEWMYYTTILPIVRIFPRLKVEDEQKLPNTVLLCDLTPQSIHGSCQQCAWRAAPPLKLCNGFGGYQGEFPLKNGLWRPGSQCVPEKLAIRRWNPKKGPPTDEKVPVKDRVGLLAFNDHTLSVDSQRKQG